MTRLADEDGTLLRRAPDGDLVPATDPQVLHDARCNDGWLSDPDADTAVPCMVCRPHLKRPAGPRWRHQPTLDAR